MYHLPISMWQWTDINAVNLVCNTRRKAHAFHVVNALRGLKQDSFNICIWKLISKVEECLLSIDMIQHTLSNYIFLHIVYCSNGSSYLFDKVQTMFYKKCLHAHSATVALCVKKKDERGYNTHCISNEIKSMQENVSDFLALLCATAQQSYCRYSGVRPSLVWP